jgi:hypothetical protein
LAKAVAERCSVPVAYLALFSGVMCLAISPIFVSLAKVNGFTAAFYRVTIAATVLGMVQLRVEIG